MPYCTQTDITAANDRNILTQIAGKDDGSGATVLDSALIEAAITRAGGEIDSALRAAGYSLPLSTVPDVLPGFAVILAIEWLYGRSSQVPESEEKRADRVRQTLREYATGALKLEGVGADEIESGGDYEEPVFSGVFGS